jgi:hypothetical protein
VTDLEQIRLAWHNLSPELHGILRETNRVRIPPEPGPADFNPHAAEIRNEPIDVIEITLDHDQTGRLWRVVGRYRDTFEILAAGLVK